MGTDRKISLAVGVSLFLSACSPKIHQHGWIPPSEKPLEGIKAGVTTKDQVQSAWGKPTFISTFDEQSWYYVSRVTRSSTSLSHPDLLSNTVYKLVFSANGILKSFEALGKDQIQAITMLERETPTRGNAPSVLKQIFKNIGRVNAGAPIEGSGAP